MSDREARLEAALRDIIEEADVVGDDPYSDLYIDKLWEIAETARKALSCG